MEFRKLTSTCYYFDGPVNIGYIHHGEEGMLVDAGIDASTMKKVLKVLEKKAFPITHLFITHAHADHYGGADHLHQKYSVHTIAPVLEEAILRNPMLEPLYLFGGNDPLPELRNKFLEGKSITIDQTIKEGSTQIGSFAFTAHHLPGHSYYQLGIVVDDILFAGDSYFAADQLKKHKIPFITDAFQTLGSLEKIKKINCKGAFPGHGTFEEEFCVTVDKNIHYHQALLDWLEQKIGEQQKGITHETIVSEMCQHFGVDTPKLSQWLLIRTAITGYLIGLIKQDKISYSIEMGRWLFRPSS
ncbi:MBL fold metallo-hydrolase [Aquibacillus sp. 3ASR75-11]|uniref:MBL fold metallo-hydrolase n=1 Tax=Terrihalobacillus insolitus TaxID=2950438 RepID=A0A9X4APE3_9BACI|nr:MBL fold metallo-hydrolase [Terrihalobacillus insolitus]MDC3425468.1 MBL fold metallo-hydrolase [Terrihalobacillus insolitus]